MESIQRTPSVIAKLMGLDELQPRQPESKPGRVLSENYLRKSASIGLLEKRQYRGRPSCKGDYEKGQEFISGLKVSAVPTMDRHCIHSTQGLKPNSSTTEGNKTFIGQKSMDAKHLVMEFQHSNVFSNVLEEQDSAKDILPRNHQKQDFVIINHLHDLQSGHPTVLKSSSTPYSKRTDTSRKSEKTSAQRKILRSLQKLANDSYTDSCGDLGVDYARKLLKSRLELKNKTSFPLSRCVTDDTHHSPSRIVVLKPNLGKAQHAAMPSFSTISAEDSHVCDRKLAELYKPQIGELHKQVGERKNLADYPETSRPSICSNLTAEVSRTKINANDIFKNEFEVVVPSCPSFSDWGNLRETTYPPLSRSSFANQAKKQISERWEIVKGQAVGVAGRGTTLSEILAIPSQETGLQKLNCKLDISGMKNQSSSNAGDQDLGSPLGISSADGWKEECNKSLTRSESLPTDCITLEMPQTRNRNLNELKNSCGENDRFGKSEENTISPDSPINNVAETGNVGMSSGAHEEQQSAPVHCILSVKHANSSHALDASVEEESSMRSHETSLTPSRFPTTEPECPRVGEGCSPSPISVLEPPFSEENLSDSEGFQGVGANLQDLRMQLQLLTSESEGTSIVLSSDEDSGDGSIDYTEENKHSAETFRAEESRDFSYLVEVLDEAGFHGSNTSLGFKSWCSPDSPVFYPSVFEVLEKKYSNQTSWDTSERRLMFDYLNFGLKEILQPCMDVLTWGKPLKKKFNLSREMIEEELRMFLVSQRKEVSKHLSEKALGTEIRWFDLWEDIDSIVCEIERLLFDELAAELVSIASF